MSILINAKYNPIKITYDAKSLNNLDNHCLRNTILTKTESVFLVETGWYNGKDWYCLASQNELIIDMNQKVGSNSWNERAYKVQGDSIPRKIKFLNFSNFTLGPCNYLSASGVTEPMAIRSYPNPATDALYFGWTESNLFGEGMFL